MRNAMPLPKKILFVAFSLFLGHRTFVLMQHLMGADVGAVNWMETGVNAFVLTLYATGIFAFLGFAFKTSRLLPANYYRTQHPQRLEMAYRILGVRFFRQALLLAYWGRKRNRTSYFDGTRAGLAHLVEQTRQSEFGHLAALVFIGGLCIPLFRKGHWQLVAIATGINIVGNLYPIILQRKHRVRIEKITGHGSHSIPSSV
ncbi:MAG: hypothetical protein AAGB22_08900 [Bacteroidota bacterium]